MSLGSSILSLSFFRTNFKLFFQGKSSIVTCSAFLFSLAILSILVIFASQSDIFRKISPKVVDSTSTSDHRQLIRFNGLKALGVLNDITLQTINDPSIINFNIVHYYYNIENGSDYNEVKVPLHLCSEDDFPEDPSLFTKLGLQGYSCLNESMFELEGYWDEAFIKYLSVQVSLCDNLTSSIACQSYDVMRQTLKGKNFQLFYYDSTFDSSNYADPIKKILVSQWTYIDMKIKKDREIFLQNAKIISEDGILFNNFHQIEEYQYESENRDIVSLEDGETDRPLIIFSFVASKYMRNISRNYQKISDLFASLGGTFNILIFFCFLWVKTEANFIQKKTILNELYSFRIKGEKKNDETQNQLKSNAQFSIGVSKANLDSMNQIIKDEENIQKSSEIQIEMSNSKDQKSNTNKRKSFFNKKRTSSQNKAQKSLTEKISKFQKDKEQLKKNKIHMNFCNYWKMQLKILFRIKLNEEERIFRKSHLLFLKDLDYLEMVKKLQDIEKLKHIILNENQLKLFNFLSKPSILIDLEKEKKQKNLKPIYLKIEGNEEDEIKKIIEYFETKKKDGSLSEVDQKLLDNLDEENAK